MKVMEPSVGGGGGGGGGGDRVREHLLEITVISAQELHPWSRPVRAYAAAWVRPDQKLYTQVDRSGGTNPTWNDKFVFRVDEPFLRSDTSAVTVSLRASRPRPRLSPRPDPVLGVVRVLLSSFPIPRSRVAALQVRRPASLRPQGILNVAVALLDPYIRSMPLCHHAPPAFALKDLATAPRPKPTNLGGKRIHYEEEEEGSELGFRGGDKEEKGASMADRSGPLEESRSAEMRELESKIERWKTELSPEHDAAERKGRRGRRSSSCFCGGPDWER